jgi:exonuclease VII large subunit
MSSDYDAAEFVDGDFQTRSMPRAGGPSPAMNQRAPSREEVDTKVAEAQQKLAELKRAQEELERERAALEETRRRQAEFQTGRNEMVQNLTRGVGLLEETEFNLRRDAEQMAKSLVDLRDALGKLQKVQEESWTQENFLVELTKALTAVENARMEWNAARVKFPVLSTPLAVSSPAAPTEPAPITSVLGTRSFGELCRLGFALTWPIALVISAGVVLLTVLLLRR